MSEKRPGTVQLHIRVAKIWVKRLDAWLHRTKRNSFGARGAEIERMLEEGIKRRERQLLHTKGGKP